jgi:hypothetical protein
MSIDPKRRSALLGLKLAALVNDHVGSAETAVSSFPGGAALTRLGEAWVLADDKPHRILGPALAWAGRQPDVTRVNVLVEEGAGIVARRAQAFRADIKVWAVDGRTLTPALPEAPIPTPALATDLLALSGEIAAAGADPVCEWGVLVGEVAGLEVCRVIVSAETGLPNLAVGVGAHDREAFAMLHGDRPPLVALQGVVQAVAPHRMAGATPHALNRIATERLLRARLIDEPGIVGATVLVPNDPPVARLNVKDPVPCVATGTAIDGTPMTVVCSVGIDLDLVPFAADARMRHGGRLVVVIPTRDAHAVTLGLLGQLREPAELVTVADPV